MLGSNYFGQDYFGQAPSNPFNSVSDTSVTSESLAYYSEQVDIHEQINLLVTGFVNVSDSTTTSEAITLPTVETLNVSDASTTSESINVTLVDNVLVSDSITTNENIIVFTPLYFINVSDATTTSESLLLLDSDGIGVLDTTVTSESVSLVIIPLNVNVSDSSITSENVQMRQSDDSITVSDSVSTVDSLSSYAETVYTSEFVNILIPKQLPVSDSITISESVSLSIFSIFIDSENFTITIPPPINISMTAPFQGLTDTDIFDQLGSVILDESGLPITDGTTSPAPKAIDIKMVVA